jgi:DnaK suppressor protein
MTDEMDSIRQALLVRRDELESDLARLTEPPTEGVAVAFGKRVGDGTSEAVERLSTTAAARSITASLTDVNRALAKLDEDTYGLCDTCGRPIAPARLSARPTAALCMECASR